MTDTELIRENFQTKTYRMKIAEFGEGWKLTNCFGFFITHVENGTPRGYPSGAVTGENLGYCAICGTDIYWHYTVTKDNKEVNIGVMCFAKVLGEDASTKIQKAVASITNRVRRHFTEPLVRNLIIGFLDENGEKLHALRNARIDREEVQKDDYFICNEHKTRLCEKCGLDSIEKKYRDFWLYHAQVFKTKTWSPHFMLSEYKKMASLEGIALPKLMLTQGEEIDMNSEIAFRVKEYMRKFV